MSSAPAFTHAHVYRVWVRPESIASSGGQLFATDVYTMEKAALAASFAFGRWRNEEDEDKDIPQWDAPCPEGFIRASISRIEHTNEYVRIDLRSLGLRRAP